MRKRQNSSNNFQSTSSCRYLLQVHLIFVVKYRKKLLEGSLNDDILQKLFDISKKYDFEIKTMNSDVDHLHMIVSMKPSISVSQIVRVLKQESTTYVWKKYKQYLKTHFWKEHTFWSDGYFVASIGNANEKTI
jgi:putative transposase